VKPLKWGSRSGPAAHCVVTTDDSGTIWFWLLRVYRRVRSSGFCRYGAVGLHDHPPDVGEEVVLAHGQRAELPLDRAVDVLDRNAQELRLVPVDVGAQLLAWTRVGGAQPGQLRAARVPS
jgi:hypothetical protein